MNKIKVIITGATGMVGEGVLMECLENPVVSKVLMVNRQHFDHRHPKLEEIILPDFLKAGSIKEKLSGYDACFYCAGISSLGMDEQTYHHITYEVTMAFARTISEVNKNIIFNFVSGSHTDSSETGKIMWARVKGKTENHLKELFAGREYNFRPGLMKPVKGQKNLKGYNRYARILYPVLSLFLPSCTLQNIGRAMINTAAGGYEKNILEVKDINQLAVYRY